MKMTIPVARWMFVALLPAALAGCSLSDDPQSLIARAQEHRQQGKRQAAIIELRNALQKQPDNAEARYLLGLAYLDGGEAPRAEVELAKALSLGHDPKLVLPPLAQAMILQRKYEEALVATDPARVAGARGSVEILNVRSLAELSRGRLRAAKEALDLAMVLQPDYADGMIAQARIAVIEGNRDAASALVDKALAAAPKNVKGWLLRGNLQRQAGDPDAARTAYQKAVEIDPRDVIARLDLAAIQINTKHYAEAAAELEAVRKIDPRNVTAAFMKALLEFRQGVYAASLASAEKVLELSPRHGPGMLLAGAAELALGQPQKAEITLKRGIEIYPHSFFGRKLLATAQMQQGHTAQAIATLEPVLRMRTAATDPGLLALAARAYMDAKQFTKASEYFEKAAAVDPQNASARIGLGMSRVETGETDRAIEELEAAAALGGTGGIRADFVLAISHLRHKQYGQALQVISKLEPMQSNNTLIYNLKGAAYMGQGEMAKARAEFERALQIDPSFFPAAANMAQLDLQAGNPAVARTRYEAVLAKDKKHVPAMLALADIASRAPGQEKEVLDWFNRAKAASPGTPAPLLAELDYFRRTGQTAKAIASALELKALRPINPDLHLVVGQALLALGQKSEAVALYSERAALLPDSPVAQLQLAHAQMAAQYPLAAAKTLRDALRMKPDYRDAQVALVAAEVAQNRYDEATQIAKRVQYDLPNAPLGYVLEGDVLMAAKRFAPAAALYEKAYARGKSPLIATMLFNAWSKAGKPEQGEVWLKDWLKEHPDDLTMRRTLAYAAMQREKYPLAIEQYRQVLAREPTDAATLNNIAWALYKTKNATALGYAKQAHELKPGDPLFADTLAQILVEQGNLPQGLELLEKAVAAAPSNREIRFHLARAQVKSGNKNAAIDHLKIVLAGGTTFPEEADAVALLKQLRQ